MKKTKITKALLFITISLMALFFGFQSNIHSLVMPLIHPLVQPPIIKDIYNDERYEWVAIELYKKLLAGKFDELEEYFKVKHKALNVNGRDNNRIVFLKWFEDDSHSNNETKKAIDEWVKQKPKSPYALAARAESLYSEAWLIRGNRYINRITQEDIEQYSSKLKSSLNDITNAIKISPDLVSGYERKMEILGQIFGYEDKIKYMPELLKQALENNVSDPVIIYDLYRTYLYTPKWGGGDPVKGLEFARKISKEHNDSGLFPILIVFAHYTMADFVGYKVKYYHDPEVWKEVDESYKKIEATYPKAVRIMLNHATNAHSAKKLQLAADYFNKIFSIDPYFTALYLEAGAAYTNPSTYSTAEMYYNQYIILRPDDELPYKKLAAIYLEKKDFNSALETADKGIKIVPKNKTTFLLFVYKCQALFGLNKYNEALESCNEAINLDSYSSSAYKSRAKIYEAMGRKDLADEDMNMYNSTKD